MQEERDINKEIAEHLSDWKKREFQPNEWVYWGFGYEYCGQVFGFYYHQLDTLVQMMNNLTGPGYQDIFFCDLLDDNPRWVYSVYNYRNNLLYFIDQKYLTAAREAPGAENDMLIPKPLYEVGEKIQWSVRPRADEYPVWIGAGTVLAKEYAYTSSQIISKARNRKELFSSSVRYQLPCWMYLIKDTKLPYSDDADEGLEANFWIPESFVSPIPERLLEPVLDKEDSLHPLIAAIEQNNENYEDLELFASSLKRIFTRMSSVRLNTPRRFSDQEFISWNSKIFIAEVFDDDVKDWVEIYRGQGFILDAVYVEDDLESFLYFNSISREMQESEAIDIVDWDAFHLASCYNSAEKITGWVYLISIDSSIVGVDVKIWLPEIFIKKISLHPADYGNSQNSTKDIQELQLCLCFNDIGDSAIPPSLTQRMIADFDLEEAYIDGVVENINAHLWDTCF